MPYPTKLTPEVHEKAVELVREGQFANVVAALCGISEKTYYEWLARGDAEPDSIYAEFARDIRVADAEFEREAIQSIRADPKGHRGDQWFLERRHRNRYSATVRAEVTGAGGAPVVDVAALAAKLGCVNAVDGTGSRTAGPDPGGAAPPAAEGSGLAALDPERGGA